MCVFARARTRACVCVRVCVGARARVRALVHTRGVEGGGRGVHTRVLARMCVLLTRACISVQV